MSFKNDPQLWNHFCLCARFPLHTNGSSRRHKQRSVSELCSFFGNLCMYKLSALQKMPFTSLQEAFQFSKEAFLFVAQPCRKHMVEKCSEGQHYMKIHTINISFSGWTASMSGQLK